MPPPFTESDPPAAAPTGAPSTPKPPPRTPVTITVVEVDAAPEHPVHHDAAPTRRYQVIELDGAAAHAVKTLPSAQLAERAAFHHALRTNAPLTLDPDILMALWCEAQTPMHDHEADF